MPRILAALALVCALALPAHAADCPAFFLDGTPPAVPDLDTRELCNEAFAVQWSPATRDPVYAAEHLTAAGLSTKVPRKGRFFADPRTMPGGALLTDYRGQRRYDRGHMAPAHDMPTAAAMRQSFSLANMVPQYGPLNRGEWAKIEEATRTLVVSVFADPEADPKDTGGWVVTGPIFDGEARLLHGRVAVPTRIFKALYVKGDAFGNPTSVGAWIVDNAAQANPRFVSISTLQAETGIDAFPSLPSELRDKAWLTKGARARTGVGEGM